VEFALRDEVSWFPARFREASRWCSSVLLST